MAIRVSVCVLVSLFVLFYFSTCQINFVSVCVLCFCFAFSFRLLEKEGFYGDLVKILAFLYFDFVTLHIKNH